MHVCFGVITDHGRFATVAMRITMGIFVFSGSTLYAMNCTSCPLSWAVPASEWSREPDLTPKTLIQRQTRMTSLSISMDATTVPPWNLVGRYHYHMGTGTGWTGYMTASLWNPAPKWSYRQPIWPNKKRATIITMRYVHWIRFSDHPNKCFAGKTSKCHSVQGWTDILMCLGTMKLTTVQKDIPVLEITLPHPVKVSRAATSPDILILLRSLPDQVWAMLIQPCTRIQTEIAD